MKRFDVYKNRESGKYYAVKNGFGWPAFLFTAIWAFGYRMYLASILGFTAYFLRVFLEQYFDLPADKGLMFFETVLVTVIFGMYGNRWRRSNLVKRGFDKLGTQNAQNSKMAVELHLETFGTQST